MSHDTQPLEPVNPQMRTPYTDTVGYYQDHRELLAAIAKRGKDIEEGMKIFKLIYAKEALKDPMLAVLMFQQELLPLKQDIEDCNEGIFADRLNMNTDLNNMVNTVESLFNKGDKITHADAEHMAFLLLFLTKIPYADDLDKSDVIVNYVQGAMKDLADNHLWCDEGNRNLQEWTEDVFTGQRYLFELAEDQDSKDNTAHQKAIASVKMSYDDCNQATEILTSSGKALQNDAKQEVNNQKAQLGGYAKMADMQTTFMKQSNQNLDKAK